MWFSLLTHSLSLSLCHCFVSFYVTLTYISLQFCSSFMPLLFSYKTFQPTLYYSDLMLRLSFFFNSLHFYSDILLSFIKEHEICMYSQSWYLWVFIYSLPFFIPVSGSFSFKLWSVGKSEQGIIYSILLWNWSFRLWRLLRQENIEYYTLSGRRRLWLKWLLFM